MPQIEVFASNSCLTLNQGPRGKLWFLISSVKNSQSWGWRTCTQHERECPLWVPWASLPGDRPRPDCSQVVGLGLTESLSNLFPLCTQGKVVNTHTRKSRLRRSEVTHSAVFSAIHADLANSRWEEQALQRTWLPSILLHECSGTRLKTHDDCKYLQDQSVSNQQYH